MLTWAPRSTLKVESYNQGYPRFSALVSSHDSFFVCRRFARLRARLLLLKQDKLAALEGELDRIDQEEQHLLFLGRSRSDRNAERAAVLSEIETRLKDYGKESFSVVLHT